MVSDQKGQLERLLLVKPWVAETSVVGGEVVLIEVLTPTKTLSHRITRQLQVYSSQVTALLLVDAQGLLQFAENIAKVPCFDATSYTLSVAVHGVALPDDSTRVLAILHRPNVGRKEVGDLVSPVASDEGDFAFLAGRVEGPEEGQEIIHRCSRTDLDTNGVGNTAEELDVSVVDLPGSVADPKEVSGRVVVFLGVGICGRRRRVDGVVHEASESFLVFKEEALVAGEQVHGVKLLGLIRTDGVHKPE